jgi:hypothetical protein
VSTPAISRPETVNPEAWNDYREIMGRARAGLADSKHFQQLEQIYVEFPELRREDGR